VISDCSTSNKVFLDCMWNRESFEYWDSVSNSISWVTNHTCSSSIWIKRKDSLNSDVETLNLESFEHELSHFFSVTFWIHWSFSQKNSVFSWVNSKFIWETILPDFFHIFPWRNDTWFNWIRKLQDSSHFLGLISDILFFRFNSNHLFIISWDSDNWWEFYRWLIFSCKTCLDNSWTVIDDYIFFWHLRFFYWCIIIIW